MYLFLCTITPATSATARPPTLCTLTTTSSRTCAPRVSWGSEVLLVSPVQQPLLLECRPPTLFVVAASLMKLPCCVLLRLQAASSRRLVVAGGPRVSRSRTILHYGPRVYHLLLVSHSMVGYLPDRLCLRVVLDRKIGLPSFASSQSKSCNRIILGKGAFCSYTSISRTR